MISVFFVSFSSSAQGDYRYTIYSRESGLITSTVTGIAKDSTGFFWLMSENGLIRFDGYDFKAFRTDPKGETGLLSPLTTSMFCDDKGRIFFKTLNSISRYLSSSKSFKKIITYRSSDYFLTWVSGNPNPWFCVKRNLVYIEPGTDKLIYFPFPENFSTNNAAFALLNGNYIFISDGAGIYKFNLSIKKFEPVNVEYKASSSNAGPGTPTLFFNDQENVPVIITARGIFKYDNLKNAFVEDANYNLGIGGPVYIGKMTMEDRYAILLRRDGLMEVIDIKANSYKKINLKNAQVSGNIASSGVYPGKGDYCWVTAVSGGVFKVNYKTGKVEHYFSGASSFPVTICNYVYDDGDVAFFSMPGTGFVKGEKNVKLFQPYSPGVINGNHVTFLKQNIRKLVELNSDNLLVATLDGVYTFNHRKKTYDDLRSPVNGKPVLTRQAFGDAVYDKNNNLWIGSWGGDGIYVLNYRDKKMCLVKTGKDSVTGQTYSLRCAYIDSLGYLWMGTAQNTVIRVHTHTFDFDKPGETKMDYFNYYTLNSPSLIFNIVFDIAADNRGQLFICTQNGLFTYRYDKNEIVNFVKDNTSTLYNYDIRSMAFEENMIWLGTNGGGLHLLDTNGNLIRTFHTSDGLTDEIIYSMERDEKGFLWMGTNKGLSRFDPKLKSGKGFTLRDGIQNFEFNTNSSLKTSDGLLAFGGIEGFNCFYPDEVVQKGGSQKVILTEVKVGNNDREISDKTINLKYDENTISFQFASLNLYRNEETQYAYMLEGLDKDWIFSSNRRFTNYVNIPPGNYTFKVRASNHSGQWDNHYATAGFYIATAWYNSWWFRTLMVLTACGIVYLIFVIRLNEKLRVQEIRNNIARDLHDEVGSNLSSIALFTAVAKEKSTAGKGDVQPLLKKIGDYTQISQESMNDIVWMINSINDNFENIITRLRISASEMCDAKNINLHLNFPPNISELKLDMNTRKNFYLIFKEATNNIVKYSECKNIWINITHRHDVLMLEIKDDGKGFDTSIKYAGNGLVNIHKRAELLRGKIQVNSVPGAGTSFTLAFKA